MTTFAVHTQHDERRLTLVGFPHDFYMRLPNHRLNHQRWQFQGVIFAQVGERRANIVVDGTLQVMEHAMRKVRVKHVKGIKLRALLVG